MELDPQDGAAVNGLATWALVIFLIVWLPFFETKPNTLKLYPSFCFCILEIEVFSFVPLRANNLDYLLIAINAWLQPKV